MTGRAWKIWVTLVSLGVLTLLLPTTRSQSAPQPPELVCGHAHALKGSEQVVAGRQVHRKVNPQGSAFVFGTFSGADEVRVVTEPTAEHTWFEGYAWSVIVCGRTGQHIGWRFTGAGGTFYGLLLPEAPPDV